MSIPVQLFIFNYSYIFKKYCFQFKTYLQELQMLNLVNPTVLFTHLNSATFIIDLCFFSATYNIIGLVIESYILWFILCLIYFFRKIFFILLLTSKFIFHQVIFPRYLKEDTCFINWSFIAVYLPFPS